MSFIQFNNIKDFKLYLSEIISNLNDYNIFLHEVSDYSMDNYVYYHMPIEQKALNIFEKGLLLNEYGSICGTMNLIGHSANLDVNKIVDYDYYTHLKDKKMAIIAIPKHVKIDGELVEFSSFKGNSFREDISELKELYDQYGGFPTQHHIKFCLYDAVKDTYLNKHFQLGIINVNKKENQFSAILNKQHLHLLSEQEQLSLNDFYETKIKELQKKFNTKDLKQLIVKASKKDELWWNAKEDFEI